MAFKLGFVLPFIILLVCRTALSIDLTVGDADSTKKATSAIIKNTLTFYTGDKPGGTPGVLPKPYYWWQAGALWGGLIEYWSYTGDDTYNKLVTDALLFQIGPQKNFMPENVTKEEGNDDQAFWGFSAMTAAELKFPDPPRKMPSWIALAQGVFNSQVTRWDTSTCAGGLRWQIFFTNAGYEYKNVISNGAFFQLAARLARYTGNETYSDWADKMYDWMASTPNLGSDGQVNDGSNVAKNCTDTNHDQWTYNYGTMIMGSAYMYSIKKGSEQEKWKTRLSKHLEKFYSTFYPTKYANAPTSPNIMVEINCEEKRICNPDQTSFKAYTARWLAVTTQLAPFTASAILPKLRASAEGAARQCSGGDGGNWCGQNWNTGTWDGFRGVGEQMSALSAIGAPLIEKSAKPVTAKTGGTSEGDANAGLGGPTAVRMNRITNADRVGAALLTFLMILCIIGGALWMIVGD
ncbi:glycosyl hydrolase family 76 protein [Microthyrium microscopicum]|uniref:Mannan endo-1,6-alpha-mannosidase n=1 Tax=Microthyrium microscopicum TaxID=703497 RepID=A0A6A6U0U6_9PEZI|nr:glycosyl hydrolase family 76 protein [Microthyrium microscopicum]